MRGRSCRTRFEACHRRFFMGCGLSTSLRVLRVGKRPRCSPTSAPTSSRSSRPAATGFGLGGEPVLASRQTQRDHRSAPRTPGRAQLRHLAAACRCRRRVRVRRAGCATGASMRRYATRLPHLVHCTSPAGAPKAPTPNCPATRGSSRPSSGAWPHSTSSSNRTDPSIRPCRSQPTSPARLRCTASSPRLSTTADRRQGRGRGQLAASLDAVRPGRHLVSPARRTR